MLTQVSSSQMTTSDQIGHPGHIMVVFDDQKPHYFEPCLIRIQSNLDRCLYSRICPFAWGWFEPHKGTNTLSTTPQKLPSKITTELVSGSTMHTGILITDVDRGIVGFI